jgi:hypothetical protein
MASVREMLVGRREQIVAEMAPLFEESAGIRRRLIEVHARLDELHRELKQTETALKAVGDDAAQKKAPTIMEAVIEIMRSKPTGATAREILAELNTKYFDGKIARHSLSPQLSRLKDRDGKLELQGDRWFLLPEEPSLFPPKG